MTLARTRRLPVPLLVAALAASAGLVAPPAPAGAQSSWPFACRGGGQLAVRSDGAEGVRIAFRAAPGPASSRLAPGQCGWRDRPLRAREPRQLCDTTARASQYAGRLLRSDQYVRLLVVNAGNCLRVVGAPAGVACSALVSASREQVVELEALQRQLRDQAGAPAQERVRAQQRLIEAYEGLLYGRPR